MKVRDIAEFNSAKEMRDFAATNKADFEDNAIATEVIAEMNTDIGALTDSGAMRVTARGTRRDGTLDKREAKAALYDLVKHVESNGKTIKKYDPTFDNVFVLPDGGGKMSYQQLIEVAEAFKDKLENAATLAKFKALSVDENIATMIADRLADYHDAVNEQNTGKSGSVEATGQTNATIKRVKKNRRILKQIGINIYRTNPAKLEAWKSACRVKAADQPDNDDNGDNGDNGDGSNNPPPTP